MDYYIAILAHKENMQLFRWKGVMWKIRRA